MTITKFKTIFGSTGRAPYLRVIPWHFLTTEEKARKNLSCVVSVIGHRAVDSNKQ
jgi:hypothetical protein